MSSPEEFLAQLRAVLELANAPIKFVVWGMDRHGTKYAVCVEARNVPDATAAAALYWAGTSRTARGARPLRKNECFACCLGAFPETPGSACSACSRTQQQAERFWGREVNGGS